MIQRVTPERKKRTVRTARAKGAPEWLVMRSHVLAARATAEGRFRQEIFPVKIEGAEGSELFEIDEGIRFNPDRARMGTLPASF